MSMTFLGSEGIEHYIEVMPDGSQVDKTRPYQQMKAGVKIIRESYIEEQEFDELVIVNGQPVLKPNGDPVTKKVKRNVEVKLAHGFRVKDIGKPYNGFKDKKAVKAKHPKLFKDNG